MSNLSDMPGFSGQQSHQPPPDSSFCNDQPPHGSSSATVCSSNFDLRLRAGPHQCRDENIPITSYNGRQDEIPVNEKYIYNPVASTNFSSQPPLIELLGPRHPTIFYPKKVMFRPPGEMPQRYSPSVSFPNPYPSQFYRSERPRPSRYQQSQTPGYPQQPAGVSSQQPPTEMNSHHQPTGTQRHRQTTMAHSHHQPTGTQRHRQTTMAQSHHQLTGTQRHQQTTLAQRHQQPIIAQRHRPPTMAHSHQQPTDVRSYQQSSMAQRHQQPTVAQIHQQPFLTQSHQQPSVVQGHHQSTPFKFQNPRSITPLYRYPVPHQSHPLPAHLNRPQLTPNSFNMFNMPQHYQNIRKKAISDMNYRNMKLRGIKEEFGGKNGAGIGLGSYSPIPVIQKVGPPHKKNVLSESKNLNRVGSVNAIPNDNENDNEPMGNDEEFHMLKTGQELARMCFAVEVGCQTDLSFPLDLEIVMMPMEALNHLITAPHQNKSQVEQGESGSNVLLKPCGENGRNVLLKPETHSIETTTTVDVNDETPSIETTTTVDVNDETPSIETTTTVDVNDESTTEVEIKESLQESPHVAPLNGDQLRDLNQYGKNASPDDFVRMSQEEQTQSPQLFCNISNSLEEQSITEKPCLQDLCPKGESTAYEASKENANSDCNTTGDSKSFEDISKSSLVNLIKYILDPQSKSETDSQNGSEFAYTDKEDKVESFNPLANFATLMSYTDPYIETVLSDMIHDASILSGAKLFEQHYSEEEHQSYRYNFERASLNDQFNSENTFYSEQDKPKYAFQSEQYTTENAFHSEQYNSENAFHSKNYNNENASCFEQDILTSALHSEQYYFENPHYSGKAKLVDHIPDILCRSIEETNVNHKKTESIVCLANVTSTSIAVSQEPTNVSKSSHTRTIICRNPNSNNITSENKVDSRYLSLSLNHGKTSECLDREDFRPSTSKKRCQSGLTKSEQKYKLKHTSRQKYKVKNNAGTGINLKPDIATRMSSDQYEHSKGANESIKHKPWKLSEDISVNWNMPLLDALNVTEKCGYKAGITSLKQENIQSSVGKHNDGRLTQDTVNDFSNKSQEKRSSRGRLLKKKRFYDDETTGESSSKEYTDHHDSEGKLLNKSSENLYSPSIEKIFPFHSSSKQEQDLKNEPKLEGHIENISPETKVSRGKFEGNCNTKEYVGKTNSLQKSPLKTMSNITQKVIANVNVLESDVQLGEKDSHPLKMEDKCKEPSEVVEVKVNESAKEEMSEVNIERLGDNELCKNKIMSTEDFTSDKTSSTIGMSNGRRCQSNKKVDIVKTNCKMGNRVLRSGSKAYHQENRSKEVSKKGTKQEKNKSSLKKKFDQGKEMDKKNTSMITKQLQKVFFEVLEDSVSAEFYFGIDEARPMPMYYKIDNLEIDLKLVEMKLENELYADAEQFLEDFRNIVKMSINYFGPLHQISERSRKLLDLACGLVSRRNLNLPSCPKFDLMEILNDDNNHLGVAKRHIRAAKRKTAEKSEISSSKMRRDESPDHVCEECGTIFAHFQSYTRHCRGQSGCAKALNRGKQMVGHTMQVSDSPPRKISIESPERIHFNLNDLVDLATAPAGHGDQLLKALDREIVSCKRTVQKNKFLSALRSKSRDRDVEPYRVLLPATRIIARWTNDELLLAEEGGRIFGKNFETIAQVLGTKTESQVRSFFVNYKRKYELDSAYNDEDRQVDKEEEGSRAVGTSKNQLRNETFTCKECNLQFSSEEALDDHIEVDWPECGELFGRDNPSGEDENDVSRNDVPVSHPPSPEGTSSMKPLSRRKRIPKKNVGIIPSAPRGVPVVSHPQDDIVIDADDDNFDPPGLQVRSFVNFNAKS